MLLPAASSGMAAAIATHAAIAAHVTHAAAHAVHAAHAIHAAHAASHHGVRNGVYGLAVDNDRTTIILCRAVIVKGRRRRYVEGSSVYDQIAVGIYGVGIAGAHNDGQCPAVDFQRRRISGGFIGCIYAVIGGGNAEFSVIDLDISCFQAFGGGDIKGAAIDLKQCIGVNRIIGCVDGERTARNIDVSEGLVVGVFCVQAVFRVKNVCTAGDSDAVFRPDGVV